MDQSEDSDGDGTVSVFLSYSHRNADLKRRVEASLRAAGYATRSDQDIVEGADYRSDIARLIRSSTLTVVLWTEEAFSTRWVADEAHLADELANRDGRLRYIGVIVDPVLDRLPFPLTNRQNLNLSAEGLTEAGLQRIIEVVGRFSALQGRAVPKPADPAPEEAGPGRLDAVAQELQFYGDAVQAGTAQALRAYLAHYPKGAHRAEAAERLAELTHPVRRFRKRLFGAGAAIATVLGLGFTAYPVMKDMLAPPPNLAEAAKPVPEGAGLPAAAPVALAEAGGTAIPVAPPTEPLPEPPTEAAPEPVPEPVSELAPAPGQLPAPAPAPPATPPAVAAVAPADPDSLPEVEACDRAAGSAGWEAELLALGRPVVHFDAIDPEAAIAACDAAHALVPDHPRTRHQLGRAYHKAAEAAEPDDASLFARAAGFYELNCLMPGGEGAPSCSNLGWLHAEGKVGGAPDPDRALEVYRRGCDNGHADSCASGAELLRGLAKSGADAAEPADPAEGQGPCEAKGTCARALALHTLGEAAERGQMADTPDLEAAMRQYGAACEAGLTLGCTDLERVRQAAATQDWRALAEEMARAGCAMPAGDGAGRSCSVLGLIVERGEGGGARDPAAAVALYEKACGLDFAFGCSNAALLLRKTGEKADHTRAVDLARRGCAMEGSDGQRVSCNSLGLVLKGNEAAGIAPDMAGAVDSYRAACTMSYAWGCSNAANILRETGLQEDRDEAVRLSSLGCTMVGSEGVAESCNVAGYMYEKGETGPAPDPRRALGFYQIACDGGDATACANIAVVLRDFAEAGTPAEAVTAAEHACGLPPSQDSARGCNILGDLLEDGAEGVTPDLPRALAAFVTACDRSSAWGCSNAAWLLRKDGALQDLPRALDLVRAACDLAPQEGSAQGCNRLGILLESGEGAAAPDPAGAEAAYLKACDGGMAWGCTNAAEVLSWMDGGDDAARSLQHAERACAMDGVDGQAEGCGHAAFLMAYGSDPGTEQVERALDLLVKACTLGNARHCADAADLLHDTPGLAAGHDAVALLQTGCGLEGSDGQPTACVSLGEALVAAAGGTPTEPALAAFGTACDLNDQWGCEALGRALLAGAPGPQEVLGAEIALQKACAIDVFRCPDLAELYRQSWEGVGFLPAAVADATFGALRAHDEATLAHLLAGGEDGAVLAEVQALLAAEGHDIGTPDGKMGPKTRAALAALCDCAE